MTDDIMAKAKALLATTAGKGAAPAKALPALLVALARKTESENSLADYMEQLQGKHPEQAQKIYGLLGSGR